VTYGVDFAQTEWNVVPLAEMSEDELLAAVKDAWAPTYEACARAHDVASSEMKKTD